MGRQCQWLFRYFEYGFGNLEREADQLSRKAMDLLLTRHARSFMPTFEQDHMWMKEFKPSGRFTEELVQAEYQRLKAKSTTYNVHMDHCIV